MMQRYKPHFPKIVAIHSALTLIKHLRVNIALKPCQIPVKYSINKSKSHLKEAFKVQKAQIYQVFISKIFGKENKSTQKVQIFPTILAISHYVNPNLSKFRLMTPLQSLFEKKYSNLSSKLSKNSSQKLSLTSHKKTCSKTDTKQQNQLSQICRIV